MASQRTKRQDVAPTEEVETPNLSVVQDEEDTGDKKTRTRRSFNYDPSALGIDTGAITDEDEDFVPERSRTKAKLDQVRWMEPILAETYEKDVWKGATVDSDKVDAFKQGVNYAVRAFFQNMGVSFNLRELEDDKVRVSFKMKDKTTRRRKPKTPVE